MKTSLDHLPAYKREQLQAISAAIQASVRVEMIILFGSYARGDWVEDHTNRYFSDYDLMVIVQSPEVARDLQLWGRITDQLREIAGHVPVTLLPHHFREVNQEIRTGHYFFSEVVCQGIALYDANRSMLAKPVALTPEERLEHGSFNFRYWFNSGSGFWRGAGYYMAEALTAHAAFLLHQATERYCHAVLLVFTGYKPKSHDIEALANEIAPMHEALDWELRHRQGENDRLFDLLKRAYIEARYSRSYRITLDELGALRRHIVDLAERVRRACADKLKTITEDGEIGELPPLPTPSDTIELPELPALDDRKAVEAWYESIAQMSRDNAERLRAEGLLEGERRGEERGREQGRELGIREGEERGRELGRREGEERGREQGRDEGLREGEERGRLEERARAILDVLQRRGITLSESEAERIAACRDEAMLARWKELAWTVMTSDELMRH